MVVAIVPNDCPTPLTDHWKPRIIGLVCVEMPFVILNLNWESESSPSKRLWNNRSDTFVEKENHAAAVTPSNFSPSSISFSLSLKSS